MMRERAFIYGDLLFESIRVHHGVAKYLPLHYVRLIESAAILEFDAHDFSYEVFEKAIRHAVNGQQELRVRFVLYRDSEGFYTPSGNKVGWQTEVFALNGELKRSCNRLGVFDRYAKPCNSLSNVKSGNALLQVMAGIYAKKNGYGDCLLMNEKGRVAEAISSNVFVLHNGKWRTPPLSEGCVKGVMRTALMTIGHIAIEETALEIKDILDAEEIFLTNAVHGIIPVHAFGDKTYPTTLGSGVQNLIGF